MYEIVVASRVCFCVSLRRAISLWCSDVSALSQRIIIECRYIYDMLTETRDFFDLNATIEIIHRRRYVSAHQRRAGVWMKTKTKQLLCEENKNAFNKTQLATTLDWIWLVRFFLFRFLLFLCFSFVARNTFLLHIVLCTCDAATVWLKLTNRIIFADGVHINFENTVECGVWTTCAAHWTFWSICERKSSDEFTAIYSCR